MKKMPYKAIACLFPLGLSTAVLAEHPLEEVHVEGVMDSKQLVTTNDQSSSADSGQLLKNIAGANINRNGALTSIAQYRGMYGDRVNVSIDGLAITSGGPNAMDAPLHYAPAPMISSLSVYRGIAPVSAGQQTIGGAIVAKTQQGEFSENDQWQVNGQLTAAYGSAAAATDLSVFTAVGDNHHKVFASALTQAGDDYTFPGGDVIPSEYERDRYEAGYAYQNQSHFLSLSYMDNATGDAGTPALPMDIELVDSQFIRSEYRYSGEWVGFNVNIANSDVEHVMTNYHLRQVMDPTKLRSTLAVAEAEDIKISTKIDVAKGYWNVGMDYHNSIHDSDISDPNNGMFFIENFNQAENQIAGFFVETQQQLSSLFSLDAGLRLNRVTANSDTVDTSMAMMPPVMMLRDAFNNAEREQTDDNVDAVLKLSLQADEHWLLYAGLAQKTRSGSYQERYLWLPLQSTGGLADGFNYIGNIDIKPEVAQEVELGFDWHSSASIVSPRVFYRDVSDYIQGTPTTNAQAIMVSNMMGNPNPPLEFNNVDAKLYGFDMPWRVSLDDNWALRGAVSVVRGERKDIDDYLYRISPDNIRIATDFTLSQWKATVEVAAYDKQDKVSATNNEQQTAGYGLLNLSVDYAVTNDFKVLAGVENVLDKQYQDHLSGINRAMGSDVAVGERLPGMGRNAYARISWVF